MGEVRGPCNSWLWWPSLRLTFLTLSHFMLAWWHSLNRKVNFFTYLRNDSVFGFAQETDASRADNFCCLGRPQISSFFIDIAKVQNFQYASKLFLQKKHAKKHAAWNAFRFATVLQLLQFFLGLFYSSDYTYIFIYINIYINIEEFLSLKIGFF